jgi:predicted transglutaminase-like cysteine proteinase
LRRVLALGAAAFAAALAGAQALGDLGFTTRISTGLTAEYARRFGPPVPERFGRWSAFAKAQKAAAYSRSLEGSAGREAEVLQLVNDAVNGQMKWVDDRVHWGAEDYWATPAESSASAGGDCEDFSIAKYYLLKELGVPLARLRITYVRVLTRGGQAHMVLAYYATPAAEPLILDNFDGRVRPASQRTDLDPVYSFNDDEVQIKGAARGKPSQIRAWLTLQQHLVAETRL